ncbi:MAG: septum formation initiator family protein [bacterium]
MKDSPINDLLTLVLLAVFVTAVLVGGWCVADRYRRFATFQTQIERLRAEIESLQEERKRLAYEGDILEKDPLAWETAVRERLGYTREGEVIVRVETESHT